MNIDDWPDGLGLGSYRAVLAENAINPAARFDGYIANFPGDGVPVTFGGRRSCSR